MNALKECRLALTSDARCRCATEPSDDDAPTLPYMRVHRDSAPTEPDYPGRYPSTLPEIELGDTSPQFTPPGAELTAIDSGSFGMAEEAPGRPAATRWLGVSATIVLIGMVACWFLLTRLC